MKRTYPLFSVGDVNAGMQSVLVQASGFMSTAYGKVAESGSSMTECRVKMWRTKIGKSGATSVKLSALPPTTDAFIENVYRCHMQVANWK